MVAIQNATIADLLIIYDYSFKNSQLSTKNENKRRINKMKEKKQSCLVRKHI